MRRWRLAYAAFALLVLCAPLIAMHFTTEVAWSPSDFMAATGLLAAVWIAIELAVLVFASGLGRRIGVAAVIAIGLLVWAQLAVGVF